MNDIETSSNANIAELLDKALNAPTRNNLVLRLREGEDLGSRYDAVSEIIRLREANAELVARIQSIKNVSHKQSLTDDELRMHNTQIASLEAMANEIIHIKGAEIARLEAANAELVGALKAL